MPPISTIPRLYRIETKARWNWGLRVQLRKQQNNGSVYWMHRESARERYGDT